MALTGKLGISDSQLGNIRLAGDVVLTTTLEASNALVLNQSVTVGFVNYEDITSVINFSQTARGFNGTKIVGQSISLSQALSLALAYSRSITDTLIFVQAANVELIKTASNTITFIDEATVETSKGVGNTITFNQTVTHQYTPHFETSPQLLTFIQSAVATNVFNRSLSDTITFTHEVDVKRVRFFNVNHFIAFQNNAASVKILQPSDVLTLSHEATQFRVINRSVSNSLNLTHDLARQLVLTRSITHTLEFKNYHDRRIELGGIQPAIITVPTVVVTKPAGIVILQVPDRAITFKSPLFGDTEGGLGQLTQQRTIDGSLYTYVKKTRSRKLKYTFEIAKNKAREVRDFMFSYLSDPMRLTNWKGEMWYGYIVNNPFTVTSKSRRGEVDLEGFTIEIEFEGVRLH